MERRSWRQYSKKSTLWLSELDTQHIMTVATRFGISQQDSIRLLLHLGWVNLGKLGEALQGQDGPHKKV